MYQADPSPVAYAQGGTNWLRRAEDWLDARGRKAWIISMVLGFIVFWPVGLALLAYMIWGKKMFGRTCNQTHHNDRRDRWAAKMERKFERASGGRATYSYGSSGNAAFDSYKDDMLRRLEAEQTAFEAFLQRLRDAKDKSEFDAFMEDRARTAATPTTDNLPEADPDAPKRGDY
jgi:Protein of unknown function (DUF2852)